MRWMLLSSKVLAFCLLVISSKLGCLQRPGDGVATTFCDVCELAGWGGFAAAELFRVGVIDDAVCRIKELVEEDMAWKESAVSDSHMYLALINQCDFLHKGYIASTEP